eukprot:PhF_6_TR10196/c0_g1_i1/m.15809
MQSIPYSGPSLIVYKLVGDEKSVCEYFEKCAPPPSPSSLKEDWSAMYFQMTREHAVQNAGYRWDKGYPFANLFEITFRSEWFDIVHLDSPLFVDGSVDGKTKAAAVKELFGIDQSLVLMEELGKRSIALLVAEAEDQVELIVPHTMTSKHNGGVTLSLSDMIHSERFVAKELRPKWL